MNGSHDIAGRPSSCFVFRAGEGFQDLKQEKEFMSWRSWSRRSCLTHLGFKSGEGVYGSLWFEAGEGV